MTVEMIRTDQERERLSPVERLEALCDRGSLTLLRSDVRSRRMGEKARAGDGVIAGTGRVDGRTVFCYAQDPSYLGGSLGEQHAESIVKVLRLAGRAGAPVVGFIESGGARMQEGTAALAGYARIFREHVALSGKVPQISVICGASAGGGSYSPALTDFVIMTERANMFLTGPAVVREVMGEDVDAFELGGPKVHERNGVSHFLAETDADAALLARDLLDHLPANSGERAPQWRPVSPVGYGAGEPVPEDERKVYDVRDVIRGVVDGGRLLEWGPKWAKNIVCGFARMEGRPVGVIANQPRYLGGVLDSEAASKGARFVRTCNAFGLPLVVLVDTPGFMPGTKQERMGVIRHGAKLVHAFAEATVPKVTVVLRKAFGGAFIAMNARDLGADYTFAWPQAQLGVMGAKQAVTIVNRRDIAAADDPTAAREVFAAEYADEHLSAATAAAEGYIDEVILPGDTRRRLSEALSTLEGIAEPAGTRNIPL
ncbi:MAG TPA: acyl-CoA carboxylase subunit beta [Solirubrobacteraceae bacterium]|nr:acyl-CoA carboxylase subunit beta [Solirubrobacteraceae bacterium]